MKEFTVTFWTPETKPYRNTWQFGCASHGFATTSNWVGPEKRGSCSWEEKLKGNVISGTYQEVLNRLEISI